jgi:hypothetical protein
MKCIRYIFRNNAEFPIMTASEMQFLKAEAQLRKGDKAGALASYTNAINLNFDMLTTKYTAMIPARQGDHNQHPGKLPGSCSPTAANLTLTHIMLQKYIALYGFGFQETWADMRRYHYNKILIQPPANRYTSISRRLQAPILPR